MSYVELIIIIIIRNSYIAPNPTGLAQSTSQFKTKWTSESIHEACIHQTIQRQQQTAGKHARIPEQPVQPRHACNAAIHGPSKYLIIANQIQRATKTGFYRKVWENKWVFSSDLNEEYVCVWRMEKGRLFQVTGP